MKTVSIANHNGVIPDLSSYFHVVDYPQHTLADAIVVWTDAITGTRTMCNSAKERGVPSFVIQHGFNIGDTIIGIEYPDQNRETRTADYYLLWAERNGDILSKFGWNDEDIITIGNTITHLKKSREDDGKTVAFFPRHQEGEDNNRKHSKSMDIWETIRGIEGIHPIIKLLEDHDSDNIKGEQYITIREHDFSQHPQQHVIDTYDLLSKTSCVVAQYPGTFVFMCFSMGIPVIQIIEDEYELPVATNGITYCRLSNLDRVIKFILGGNYDRQAMENTLNTYCPHNPDPAKTIAELIERSL